MKTNPHKLPVRFAHILSIVLVFLWMQVPGLGLPNPQARVLADHPAPRVNISNLSGVPFTPAIFWFGKVDLASNYADVRVYYEQDSLEIVVHIIDRLLWYDAAQDASQLDQWDALSIYLNLEGNTGVAPGPQSYLLQLQLENLQMSYQGNGATWLPAALPFTAYSAWRGEGGPNSGDDNEGWVAYFEIPFTSLGLSAAPVQGTVWGMGVTLHDRDTFDGSRFQETYWPASFSPDIPSTWGQLAFGQATFTPPRALPVDTVTIRQGLDDASVVDGEVGGHTTCGNDGYAKWTDWGDLNYAGALQINIQNQWDIADWPCFSKFYITFPISAVPSGYTIISATMTMSLFGTAGGGDWGDPPDSYIEVLTVRDDWNEASLTWNNAPLASENISGTWVPPVAGNYHWDVSKAVDQAYQAGVPLKLAVYSIDGERHSGKYFYSSDSNDWNGEIRPTLQIVYGKMCTSPGVNCFFAYLPSTQRK
jgi:hypothetical protein